MLSLLIISILQTNDTNNLLLVQEQPTFEENEDVNTLLEDHLKKKKKSKPKVSNDISFCLCELSVLISSLLLVHLVQWERILKFTSSRYL